MNPELLQIWSGFSGQLRRFIRARVSDPTAAEDILQDVFLKIGLRLGQLQTPGKISGWVYAIARHAVADHYRRQRPTVEVTENLPAEGNDRDDVEEGLRDAFRRMISSLPRPYREALILTEFDGLTQRQLSERVGISLSGAKSRVQRGRDMLRRMLLECCRFEFDRRGHVIECAPRAGGGCEDCS